MMTTKTDTSMLKISRTVKAPVDRVFKAWTEPTQMSKWFGCGGTNGVQIVQDLRVGGEYSVTAHLDDGKIITMSGKYLEIVPERKLVYTWNSSSEEYPAKDTLVTVEFVANGDTTEIILEHSKFDRPVSVQGHTIGWGDALDKFAGLFA
jgi:uncharacterized protein YndB with AHSA1/START domain